MASNKYQENINEIAHRIWRVGKDNKIKDANLDACEGYIENHRALFLEGHPFQFTEDGIVYTGKLVLKESWRLQNQDVTMQLDSAVVTGEEVQ